MKKIIVLYIISIIIPFNLYADDVRIQGVSIVNQNETEFKYKPIFRNKVPFKYLLSRDVMFKIEGENFEGYDYKGSLIIEIGQEIFESLVYDTRNSEEVIYFNVDSIREKIIELDADIIRFKFCPQWIINSDCAYSKTIEITKDNMKYNDTFSSFQYYLWDSNIIKAKEKAGAEFTPTIAVIDDGISIQHSDLEWMNWINKWEINGNWIDDDNNGYIDDYYGWNFVDNNNFMYPKWDHWTNVAWIISAVSDNDIWISWVSNSAELMPLIWCDEKGCSSESINSSIVYAVDNGANIINLSLGAQWFNYSNDFSDSINYAKENNVIIVTSLWNWDVLTGKGLDTTNYKISPVCDGLNNSDVIWVAALSIYSDLSENWLKTNWTNYGDCTDIYAYGESIVTLTRDGNYDILDGTSFSAPIITWIIALWYNKYWEIDREIIYNSLNQSQQTWHWIDANKYLDMLQENIEIQESEAMEKKEIQEKENKNQTLYDKLDAIEDNIPWTLLSLLPALEKIKTQEKYKKYESMIDTIIDYINSNY